jgi:hypothetical protein
MLCLIVSAEVNDVMIVSSVFCLHGFFALAALFGGCLFHICLLVAAILLTS